MTLIAALAPFNVPMLLGDLLVTGPVADKRRSVGVPAVGDVTDFFGGSGWGIGGLHQKIAIINEKCAVAWTGQWLGARVAIANLRQAAAEGLDLSVEGIFSVLRATGELEQHPASFIGWVTTDGTGFHQFRFGQDIQTFTSQPFGQVATGGSGISAVVELERLFQDMAKQETGDTVTNGDRALTTGLMLGGLLLQAEYRGGEAAPTLREMFGGGYEIAMYVNGGFAKIGGITYVIWDAKVDEKGCWLGPRFVLSQAYSGDVLMFRSFAITQREGTLGVTNEGAFAINPMYETEHKVSMDDMLKMPLDSGLQSHCFVVQPAPSIYVRVQRWQKPEDRGMSFEMIGDKMMLGVNHNFVTSVAASLKAGARGFD